MHTKLKKSANLVSNVQYQTLHDPYTPFFFKALQKFLKKATKATLMQPEQANYSDNQLTFLN